MLRRHGVSNDGLATRSHIERFAVHHRADGVKIAVRRGSPEFSMEQSPHELRETDPLFRSAPLRLGVEMIRQRDDGPHDDIIASH